MIIGPIIMLIGFMLTLTDHTFLAFLAIGIGAVLSVMFIIKEW